MAHSLSVDLRKRVIDAVVDKKMRITDAAKTFNVGRKAIYRWLDLLKKTNSLTPKTGFQKGRVPKITDWEQFKDFAAKNQHLLVREMVLEWKNLTGVVMSNTTMERGLKKVGYTSKKKLLIMRKLIKQNEKSF